MAFIEDLTRMVIAAALSCGLASIGLPATAQPGPKFDLDSALSSIAPSGAGCVVGATLPGAEPVIVARGHLRLRSRR